MRRIAVALTKGGCGKSTTAVNLAHCLALSGRRVLLVDTDSQGQAAGMLGVDPAGGLPELLAGEASPREAITEARENLWLLAGGPDLAGVSLRIARMETAGERVLRDTLAKVGTRFDYTLLDTAPGYDVLAVNVLTYAREILAPVSLEALTLRGLVAFVQRLETINRRARLRYVLPTFADGRVAKTAELLEQLRAHFRPQVCEPIRYNVRLSEAAGHGLTIFEYAPRSYGAEDYQLLAERIAADE